MSIHADVDQVSLSREQVRRVDADAIRQLGIPGLLLMENAARGIADLLRQQLKADQSAGTHNTGVAHHTGGTEPQIVIVCGSGNNGGDGIALYRQLSAVGITSLLLVIDDGRELSPDAAANFEFLQRGGVMTTRISPDLIAAQLLSLSQQDWIVDALLGTGLTGAARPPYDSIIRAMNDSAAQVLAVDLPSGLNCDTGTAEGACVRANLTATFVAGKRGFNQPCAISHTGKVYVCHIGLPACWLSNWLASHATSVNS